MAHTDIQNLRPLKPRIGKNGSNIGSAYSIMVNTFLPAEHMPEVADTEYANLRGAYRLLQVEPLTVQQELMLLTHLRGMSIRASAIAAGMSPSAAYDLMKQPRIETIKEYFRTQLFEDCQIQLTTLNNMALEAHRKSANSTEELKAVETLAKLNMLGGYAPQSVVKSRNEAGEKEIGPKSAKQLESLPEDQLLELAKLDGLDDLAPARDIEGDFIDV